MPLRLISQTKLPDGTPLKIYSDIEDLKKQLKAFQRRIPMAYRNALNTSATFAKNEAVKLLTRKFALSKSALKKKGMFSVQPRAQVRNLSVAVQARGRQLNLHTNTAKTPKWAGPKSRGAQFNSGSGYKVHPHTFIADVPNTRGVFVRSQNKPKRRERKTSKKTGRPYWSELPITLLKFPSPAHMLTNKEAAPQVVAAFNQAMDRNFVAKLKDQVDKAKGVGG